jgi:membrane protease subunit HflK
MGWNDSDDDRNKNPWQSNGGKGPPDLDAVVRDLQRKLGGIFGGGRRRGTDQREGAGRGGGAGLVILAVIVLALWIFSGFYTVDEQERGVVLRFGKLHSVELPGLRWRIPFPVDAVELINVTQTERKTYEAEMLTQDENIVDVALVVQYRRADAEAFLFNVRAAEDTLDDVIRSAIREVIGKSNLDYIITEGRADVAQRTKGIIQTTLDSYGTGIQVYEVNLQDANFPSQVEASVQDAIKAREDSERMVLEAQAYSNDIIPRAQGAASRQLEDSKAYKARVIADAQGESSRFDQIRTEYERAPEVTRQRIYLETMETIYGNSAKVLLDTEGDGSLIYLPLDKLMENRSRSDSANRQSGSANSNGPLESQQSLDDRAARRTR